MQPTISVLMQFPDGATAAVNQILAGFEHHQAVEVVGDKGAVRATWSAAKKISSHVPGYSYIRRDGFSFPFGEYFEIDIDSRGQTQAVWGEGLNFMSPGSIWYSNGR